MLTGCNLPAGFLPFGMFFELSSIDAAQSTANHQRNSGMIGTDTKEEKFLELIIEIKAKPGKCQELYQTLQALLPTIRKERGCRDCRISREVEDGEVFFLSSQWERPANLEHYLRSTNGMALLGAINLLSEKARVRIGHDALWEGIDVLKRMRKKT
jgi:quinol monooxygenase YgiN